VFFWYVYFSESFVSYLDMTNMLLSIKIYETVKPQYATATSAYPRVD